MRNHFHLTDHAVEQFITRYDRNLSFEDAKRIVLAAAGQAIHLARRTFGGEHQWHIESLGIVLITKTRKDTHIVVTILAEEALQELVVQREINAQEAQGYGENNTVSIKVSFELTGLGRASRDEILAQVMHSLTHRVKGIGKDLKQKNMAQMTDIYVGKLEDL